MEAESTTSSLGSWKKKTDVPDYRGDCHLEFTGNTPESGSPKSPLKYSLRINKGGTYQLAIRCHKRLETKRTDISNDCYVSLEGDFDSGGDVPLKVLKEDTKLFGGDPTKWGWTSQLDVNHKKYASLYQLKDGDTLTIIKDGRRFDIAISSLSENDQKFLKDWLPE